jgi:thioesterase domain-containing protein/acyl carrier protein
MAATFNLSSLRSWCRERLRRDAVPEHWFIVEEIPRNARGKVNRVALRQTLQGETGALTRRIEVTADDTSSRAAGPAGSPEIWTKPSREVDVRRAVERAWTRVLDRRSFHADTPWSDAGGDSIGALSLLLYLERHLDRPVPLDLLSIDMTPSDLVRSLATIYDPIGTQPGRGQPNQELPLVFLIPPAYGDLPALAEFRASLSERIHFDVIQYPDLGEMVDRGAGFDLLVDAAVTRINAVCEHRACLLTGYSFGGFVAFEAARRLDESGRRVDLLALIDTRLESSPAKVGGFLAKTTAYIGRTWSRPDKLYRDGVWLLLSLLVRHSPLRLLRRIDDFAKMMPGPTAVAVRIEIFTLLRAHAIRGWNFKPLGVPMTLFRTDDAPSSHPDHGWSRLCNQLTVRPIPGSHRSLFEPRYRDVLCAQFMQAIEDATLCRGRSFDDEASRDRSSDALSTETEELDPRGRSTA